MIRRKFKKTPEYENFRDHIAEFADKLKTLCNQNGKETDTTKSAQIFREMGAFYRRRGSTKLSLVRSAVLFNAAIVRKPENEDQIKGDLQDLCSHLLDIAEVEDKKADLIEKAEQVFSQVVDIRNNVKEQLDEFSKTADNESDKIENQQKRIVFVESLQESIYEQYSKLMHEIMQYCVMIKGNVPCKYALVGMGSLSRKEITPYSDFEHVILLEDGVESKQDYEEILEYFRWVSVLFQFVLVNMGETIIPHISLPFINDSETKEHNWFFDAYTKRGVCFDGMVPFACKFPLGRTATRDKPWSTELIKPVSEMLKYLEAHEDLKNGYHLADILMTTCFVSGYRGLYDQFQKGVLERQRLMSIDQLQEQVKEDMKQFNPIDNLAQVNRKSKFNMKRVAYRSVSLFIAALKRFHKLQDCHSNFDVVRELQNIGVVDNEFGHRLLFCLAVSCQLRLQVYLEKDRQDDWVRDEVHDSKFDQQIVQIMGINTAITYFRTALELQRKVFSDFSLPDLAFVQRSPIVDKLLTCFWLDLKDEVFTEAKKLDCAAACDEVKAAMPVVIAVVLAVSECYFQKDCKSKALICYKYVEDKWLQQGFLSQKDSAHCMNRIARCHEKNNELEEALKYCDKEISIRLQTIESGECDPDISSCYFNQGQCYFGLELFEKSFHHLHKAKETMKKSGSVDQSFLVDCEMMLGRCLFHSLKYDEAIAHFEEELELRKQLSDNESSDEAVAWCQRGLGQCHLNLGNVEQSLVFFGRAVLIWKHKNDPSSSQNLADCLVRVVECLYKMERYEEAAASCIVEGRNRARVGVDPILEMHIAHNYFCYAHCQYRMGDFNIAEMLFVEAKRLLEKQSEFSFGNVRASCANMIGMCLQQMGRMDKALKSFNEELAIRMKISDDAKADVRIAKSYFDIAHCHFTSKNFPQALKFYDQAKAIWNNIYIPSFNVRLAICGSAISECLYRMGEFEKALRALSDEITSGGDKADSCMVYNYFTTGHCLFSLKRFEKAMEHFESAKAMWQGNAFIEKLLSCGSYFEKKIACCQSMIGECLYEIGRYEDALERFSDEFRPRDSFSDDVKSNQAIAQNTFDSGRCHLKLDRPEKALNNFKKSEKISVLNQDKEIKRTLRFEKYDPHMYFDEDVHSARRQHMETQDPRLTIMFLLSFPLRSHFNVNMQDSRVAKEYLDRAEVEFSQKHFERTLEEFVRTKETWTTKRDSQFVATYSNCGTMIEQCSREMSKK